MKVSIVIPNWNGVEKLTRNLPEVFKVKGVEEIIVSDDASTDDSVEVLQTKFPQIKLVKREKNGGFSSNVNTGVSHAKGDLVFLLNSDAVPDKNSVINALKHFKNPKVFSVSCNTGGNWSWAKWENGFFWHYEDKPLSFGNKSEEKIQGSHQTLWASGGSGIFRRDLWNEFGGLDELFDPFYEEDMDLGYRATKRGYINIFEPESRVEHYHQKGVIEENFSKSKVAKVAQRNQLIFTWKNIHSGKFIRSHIITLFKMCMFHPGYIPIVIAALSNISQILQKRKIEKPASVLNDQQVLGSF